MTLSYGKLSPEDILAKARRDLSRLEVAEVAQEEAGVSDALFDLAVCLTGVKDWLKNHPSLSVSPKTVEQYSAASAALSSFRDIANTDKHRLITKYTTTTSDILTSAPNTVAVLVRGGSTIKTGNSWRFKIVRADGSRHRAIDLGYAAIKEWESFMKLHGAA
jgi:hypothetical protein